MECNFSFGKADLKIRRPSIVQSMAMPSPEPSTGHSQADIRELHIANVVHGRFHAFDLARELIAQGIRCSLLTNYPAFVCVRFGVPRDSVKSYLLHGLASRGLRWLHGNLRIPDMEPFTHSMFSAWAADQLRNEPTNVIHCFSGVAEELFSDQSSRYRLKILVRSSAHIVKQAQLLIEEENRVKAHVGKPSAWIIERELREYGLADLILVPSSFAKDSFIELGVAPEKLVMLPLGVQVSRFRPPVSVSRERMSRIRGGRPLRVLTTGTFSFQKGICDFEKIVNGIGPQIQFRFVGAVPPEGRHARRRLSDRVEFVPKVAHYELASHYAWADVFLFPTIQDGFSVVLSQAQAGGLPILATRNSGAPDILTDGTTGWLFPIRSAHEIVERLEWCDSHREELAQVAMECYEKFRPRDWRTVAQEFRELCLSNLSIARSGHRR